MFLQQSARLEYHANYNDLSSQGDIFNFCELKDYDLREDQLANEFLSLEEREIEIRRVTMRSHFKVALKVGSSLNKLLTTSEKNDFRSIDVLFVNLLSSALGFDYKLMYDPKGELGTPQQPNGSWSGLVGMVNRSEIDFAVTVMSVTEERFEAADWSYPYSLDLITFVTFKPSYKTEWASSLKPFSDAVWVCLTASLITVSLLFYSATKERYGFQKVLLSNYGALLQKGISTYPVKISEFVIVIAWLISATFLTYCYTALLLSFLTIPTLSGVRTISDLSREVAKGTYQCFGVPGAILVETLKSSDSPVIRIIGEDMHRNWRTLDIEGGLKNKSNSRIPVFVRARSALEQFEEDYFVSEDTFFNVLLSLPVRKDFCCKDELDRVIHHIWAAGLYRKILEEEKFRSKLKSNIHSSEADEEIDSHRRLSLGDFKGAFALLVIGHTLALISFLIENVSFHCSGTKLSRKKTNVSATIQK